MKEYKYLVGIVYEDEIGTVNMKKITMVIDYEAERNNDRFEKDVDDFIRRTESVSNSVAVRICGYLPLGEDGENEKIKCLAIDLTLKHLKSLLS